MLSIKNLTVSVQDKTILHNINLSLQQGSVHVLMGPNGSGKSSLAAVLTGNPDYTLLSGSLTYNGSDITTSTPEKRAQLGVFLTFQNPPEIPGVRVLTFLKEMYCAIKKKDISVADFRTLVLEYMSMLAIDHALLYRGMHEGFSGGQKKRLEMLQVLLLEPHYTLFDEIDSGLDIDGLHLVAQALNYLIKKNPTMTVLYITHHDKIVSTLPVHYVHILCEGVLVKTGTKDLLQEIETKGYSAYQKTV